jgi:hypothetical protein
LIGEDVKPRTEFYVNVLGVSAVGIFFLGLGIYALSIEVSLGHLYSPRLLVAGGGSVFLGLIFLWQAVQWIRPLKVTPRNTFDVCPFCGAIVEKSAVFCAKCGRQLNE